MNKQDQLFLDFLNYSFAPINLNKRKIRIVNPEKFLDYFGFDDATDYHEHFKEKGAEVDLLHFPQKGEFSGLGVVENIQGDLSMIKLPEMENEILKQHSIGDERNEFEFLVDGAITQLFDHHLSKTYLPDLESRKDETSDFTFSISKILFVIRNSLGNTLFAKYQKVFDNHSLHFYIYSRLGFSKKRNRSSSFEYVAKEEQIHRFLSEKRIQLP